MVIQELNHALKRNVMDNMWLGRFPRVSKYLFVGLDFLSVSANMLYINKGVIILAACAIDMRTYNVRK